MARENEADILIIGSKDNAEDLSVYLQAAAEAFGLKSATFKVETEALGYLEGHNVRCIALYHNEADARIFDIVREVRDLRPNLPICVVSAFRVGKTIFHMKLKEFGGERVFITEASEPSQLAAVFKLFQLNPGQ